MRFAFSAPRGVAHYRISTLAGLAVLVAVSVAPIAVQADCLAPPGPSDPLRGAKVAFVGTVISTADDQHRALVRVESVWRGLQLARQVQVESDIQPPPGVVIEDMAVFNLGTKYLFVPENTREPFKFPGCGGPIQYSGDLEQYRPGQAHPPLPTQGWITAIMLARFVILSHVGLEIGAAIAAVALVMVFRRWRRRGTTG